MESTGFPGPGQFQSRERFSALTSLTVHRIPQRVTSGWSAASKWDSPHVWGGGVRDTRSRKDAMSSMKTTSTRWSIRRMLITLASTTVVWCAAATALAGTDVNTDATGVVLHGYDPVAYFTEGKP